MLNDVTNINKYMSILDICIKLNSFYVSYNDEKLHEFIQSVQIAMLQTCFAEFVLVDQTTYQLKHDNKQDETNLNDLLNLIQLSVNIN